MFIDHINIVVEDLNQASKFFVEFLHMKIVAEGELEGRWVDDVVGLQGVRATYQALAFPGVETKLELLQYFRPQGEKFEKLHISNSIGFRHIAFRVEDIEGLYSRLVDAGVEVFSEIQYYIPTNKKLFYFYGPEKIILEAAQYG